MVITTCTPEVQTLLAACRRFAMVRISDNGPVWKLGVNVFCESNIPQKQFTIKPFKLPFSGKKKSTQTILKFISLILENKIIQKFWVTFLNFHFSKQNSSICVIREAKIMHLRRFAVYITWTGRKSQFAIFISGCTYLVLALRQKAYLTVKKRLLKIS